MANSKKDTVLILCDIRSVHNVGSIFRTADTCGVSKIYLVGVTPTPKDRFGRTRKDLAKVALGAEKNIPWEKAEFSLEVLKNLKKEGFQIISIEQSKNSVDYKAVTAKEKVAFVLGGEVDGLPESVLKLSDVVAEIPMRGKKESLNVSVATGIALFRILEI